MATSWHKGMRLPLVLKQWDCLLNAVKSLAYNPVHHTQKQHVYTSKVNDITSWHLIRASFCTPMGVCRSDTWKFSTSISDAPNVASTFTFSYIWNWTFLLVMESKHRRKPSLSTDRASCSFCSCSLLVSEAAEEEMEVRQRAMKRGELGSNPRLLGSGPLGRRSTGTGVAMLTASAKACKRKIKVRSRKINVLKKNFSKHNHTKKD